MNQFEKIINKAIKKKTTKLSLYLDSHPKLDGSDEQLDDNLPIKDQFLNAILLLLFKDHPDASKFVSGTVLQRDDWKLPKEWSLPEIGEIKVTAQPTPKGIDFFFPEDLSTAEQQKNVDIESNRSAIPLKEESQPDINKQKHKETITELPISDKESGNSIELMFTENENSNESNKKEEPQLISEKADEDTPEVPEEQQKENNTDSTANLDDMFRQSSIENEKKDSNKDLKTEVPEFSLEENINNVSTNASDEIATNSEALKEDTQSQSDLSSDPFSTIETEDKDLSLEENKNNIDPQKSDDSSQSFELSKNITTEKTLDTQRDDPINDSSEKPTTNTAKKTEIILKKTKELPAEIIKNQNDLSYIISDNKILVDTFQKICKEDNTFFFCSTDDAITEGICSKFSPKSIVIDDSLPSFEKHHRTLYDWETKHRLPTLIVMISKKFPSDSHENAFAQSVDFIINNKDIAEFSSLFANARSQKNLVLRFYKKSLEKLGK